MVDIEPFNHCICLRMVNHQSLCDGKHGFSEQGKKVRFSTRSGESLMTVVMDGCILTDQQLKCDGLFFFQSSSKNLVCLVELKGANHIAHAFEQLAFVQKHRDEYIQLKQAFTTNSVGQLQEKAFIVSNGSLSKVEHEKLENQHSIRVTAILHSEATTPVPDLRNYI
ncbi:MAG: hypothetical protein ISEC1_P1689 [Thiomicrorhabdus sp.]|nr:MAG: hypothetical protein ISEC1_P1689 [Thiomicrorhabdus sp.]